MIFVAFGSLQVYELGKEIVILLLESNSDIGHLLEWVIDRCYTAQPREADACFLSLATVFSARYVKYPIWATQTFPVKLEPCERHTEKGKLNFPQIFGIKNNNLDSLGWRFFASCVFASFFFYHFDIGLLRLAGISLFSFSCSIPYMLHHAREYPCDHYTSVICVTLLMTGCPRVDVHAVAMQLLQVLDKRFFGNVGPLQTESEKGKYELIHTN